MKSRKTVLGPAILVCLISAFMAPVADAGVKKRFAPTKLEGARATFKVKGIKAKAVRRGFVRVGSYRRKLAKTSAKRAARRHRIAVKLPNRRVKRSSRRPLLVVVTSRKRRKAPRASVPGRLRSEPESPATSAPQPEQLEQPASDPAPASAPVEETVTTPQETVPAGDKATTRPVGSPILSDAEAASRVRRSSWEPRPANAAANQRTPQPGELDVFLSDNIAIHHAHKPLVTGNFTGTTDEIIQWAAWKWGLDEDILRAVATTESSWRSAEVGDGGLSFGMTQIKITYHAGTQPLSSESTAFNLDYYGALFRYYYDGHATWLNDVTRGQDYAAGDLWGSIGTHYSGRWYAEGADSYITKVKGHVQNRTWRQAGF